jgi:PEP-CTERM motif
MRKVSFAALAVLLTAGLSAHAALTTFTYTQTDASTGSGTIQGFTYDPGDGQGPITFGSTPMPAAVVVNPNPGLTPAGYVGAQNTASGNSNEPNSAVGLTFSGSVTATGTRNGQTYTIQIPLVFAPKQTQTPDVNDYTWNVTYGDNPGAGDDAVSAAALRFAMWLSRDDVVDNAETSNTFQRYTQQNQLFAAGTQESFTNTDTSSTAIKDAMDSGNPAGTDAVGRDLAFYWGWRDTSSLTSGALLVDDFTIGGILNANEATLNPPVPEPASLGLLAAVGLLGLRRRRRNCGRA